MEVKPPAPYTKNTFYKNTYCEFIGVPLREISRRKPGFTSSTGNSYYFTKKGVYRLASKWGALTQKHWKLNSEFPAFIDDLRLGYANWEDFIALENPLEDAYYISFCPKTLKIDYHHMHENKQNAVVALRSLEHTKKQIKQIKNLLENQKWAKYFSYEDINSFTHNIIQTLIEKDVTWQNLRQELLLLK